MERQEVDAGRPSLQAIPVSFSQMEEALTKEVASPYVARDVDHLCYSVKGVGPSSYSAGNDVVLLNAKDCQTNLVSHSTVLGSLPPQLQVVSEEEVETTYEPPTKKYSLFTSSAAHTSAAGHFLRSAAHLQDQDKHAQCIHCSQEQCKVLGSMKTVMVKWGKQARQYEGARHADTVELIAQLRDIATGLSSVGTALQTNAEVTTNTLRELIQHNVELRQILAGTCESIRHLADTISGSMSSAFARNRDTANSVELSSGTPLVNAEHSPSPKDSGSSGPLPAEGCKGKKAKGANASSNKKKKAR